MQSLYIGLRGSYNGKELFFDILSGDVAAPDDIKYYFKFIVPEVASFPWIRFRDIVDSNENIRVLAGRIREQASRDFSNLESDRVNDHIELVRRIFTADEVITFQELDSIDNPTLYTEDDVVEVFIRANSGGTRLGKSDLLFSLLSSSWDEADERMEGLLESLNKHGFAFDRDFVLKTCLVLVGEGARYEVRKFRKAGVRGEIENKWEDISQAIRDVLDWVRGRTFIQCDKALPSYLALIPLIFIRYRFAAAWSVATGIDTYLLRCLLAGAFSGQPDNLIDALIAKLNALECFDLNEAFNVVRDQNRPCIGADGSEIWGDGIRL